MDRAGALRRVGRYDLGWVTAPPAKVDVGKTLVHSLAKSDDCSPRMSSFSFTRTGLTHSHAPRGRVHHNSRRSFYIESRHRQHTKSRRTAAGKRHRFYDRLAGQKNDGHPPLQIVRFLLEWVARNGNGDCAPRLVMREGTP